MAAAEQDEQADGRPVSNRELTMLERLATERRQAGAYALQAQEAERQRLVRGLHDEVGQSMTAVLLHLKRLQAHASPEQRRQLDEAQEVVKTSLVGAIRRPRARQ